MVEARNSTCTKWDDKRRRIVKGNQIKGKTGIEMEWNEKRTIWNEH